MSYTADSAGTPPGPDEIDACLRGCLDGVQRSGESKWTARCPYHDDRTASLSITIGSRGSMVGRVVVHCFAGCDYRDIQAALARRGMPKACLRDTGGARTRYADDAPRPAPPLRERDTRREDAKTAWALLQPLLWRYYADWFDEQLQRGGRSAAARKLGIDRNVLDRFNVVYRKADWHPRKEVETPSIGWRETDGRGQFMNFARRFKCGDKWTTAGCPRGLVYRLPAAPPDLILITEGAGDTWSAESLGIFAIGFPSADDRLNLCLSVLDVISRVTADCPDGLPPVAVLAHRDGGAGRRWATALATWLAERLRHVIQMTAAPNGLKDLRDFTKAAQDAYAAEHQGKDLWADRHAVGRLQAEALAAMDAAAEMFLPPTEPAQKTPAVAPPTGEDGPGCPDGSLLLGDEYRENVRDNPPPDGPAAAESGAPADPPPPDGAADPDAPPAAGTPPPAQTERPHALELAFDDCLHGLAWHLIDQHHPLHPDRQGGTHERVPNAVRCGVRPSRGCFYARAYLTGRTNVELAEKGDDGSRRFTGLFCKTCPLCRRNTAIGHSRHLLQVLPRYERLYVGWIEKAAWDKKVKKSLERAGKQKPIEGLPAGRVTIEVEDLLFVVATHSFAGSEEITWRDAHAGLDWVLGMLRRPDLDKGENWQPVNYSRPWRIPEREVGERGKMLGVTSLTTADALWARLHALDVRVRESAQSARVAETQYFQWPEYVRDNGAMAEADRRVLDDEPLDRLAVLRDIGHTEGGLTRVREIARASGDVAVWRQAWIVPEPGAPIRELVAVAGSTGAPHLVWGEDLAGLPAALAPATRVVVGDVDEAWAARFGDRVTRVYWFLPVATRSATAAAAAARQLLDLHRRVDGLPAYAWREFVE